MRARVAIIPQQAPGPAARTCRHVVQMGPKTLQWPTGINDPAYFGAGYLADGEYPNSYWESVGITVVTETRLGRSRYSTSDTGRPNYICPRGGTTPTRIASS